MILRLRESHTGHDQSLLTVAERINITSKDRASQQHINQDGQKQHHQNRDRKRERPKKYIRLAKKAKI